MLIVSPGTYPKSRNPSKNGLNLVDCKDPGSSVRKQSLGSFLSCCARARNGVAAAPPRPAMNSPRLMLAPHAQPCQPSGSYQSLEEPEDDVLVREPMWHDTLSSTWASTWASILDRLT